MNSQQSSQLERKSGKIILFLSIVIPLAVATLFAVRLKDFGIQVKPLTFLPPIYAMINAVTAIVLVLGVREIKKGNRKRHKTFMTLAISLSVIFLVMYIAYHMTTEATSFGGQGFIRTIYFFILISHILLSIAIIPLVLITYVRALAETFDRHRKIARITFPLWLYVAVSGVIVYLMISPYYAK